MIRAIIAIPILRGRSASLTLLRWSLLIRLLVECLVLVILGFRRRAPSLRTRGLLRVPIHALVSAMLLPPSLLFVLAIVPLRVPTLVVAIIVILLIILLVIVGMLLRLSLLRLSLVESLLSWLRIVIVLLLVRHVGGRIGN